MMPSITVLNRLILRQLLLTCFKQYPDSFVELVFYLKKKIKVVVVSVTVVK